MVEDSVLRLNETVQWFNSPALTQSRPQTLYVDKTVADIATPRYSCRGLGYRAVTMPGIRRALWELSSAVEL